MALRTSGSIRWKRVVRERTGEHRQSTRCHGRTTAALMSSSSLSSSAITCEPFGAPSVLKRIFSQFRLLMSRRRGPRTTRPPPESRSCWLRPEREQHAHVRAIGSDHIARGRELYRYSSSVIPCPFVGSTRSLIGNSELGSRSGGRGIFQHLRDQPPAAYLRLVRASLDLHLWELPAPEPCRSRAGQFVLFP